MCFNRGSAKQGEGKQGEGKVLVEMCVCKSHKSEQCKTIKVPESEVSERLDEGADERRCCACDENLGYSNSTFCEFCLVETHNYYRRCINGNPIKICKKRNRNGGNHNNSNHGKQKGKNRNRRNYGARINHNDGEQKGEERNRGENGNKRSYDISLARSKRAEESQELICVTIEAHKLCEYDIPGEGKLDCACNNVGEDDVGAGQNDVYANKSTNKKKSNTNTGTIVGIIFGVFIIVAIVLSVLFYVTMRRRVAHANEPTPVPLFNLADVIAASPISDIIAASSVSDVAAEGFIDDIIAASSIRDVVAENPAYNEDVDVVACKDY